MNSFKLKYKSYYYDYHKNDYKNVHKATKKPSSWSFEANKEMLYGKRAKQISNKS